MKPNTIILRYALKWAMISGILLILHRIALLVLEKDKIREVFVHQILLFLACTILASILAIVFFKKIKDTSIRLKQALLVGFTITLATTLIITLYDAVFFNLVEPDYYKTYYELHWEAELEHYVSLNPEERNEATFRLFVAKRNSDHFTRVVPALLVYGTILNFFATLIVGLVLRTKQNKTY